MRESDKLVSVIVPAYNVEKYIEKCVRSVISQTYENLEIIIVDDGSSDSTWDIIRSLMAEDERVKGFKSENGGVSHARNIALENAKGYYCQFVDSDDSLAVDAVQTMVDEIEKAGSDWVNCQYNRLGEDGHSLEEYNFIKGFIDTSDENKKFDFIINKLLEYHVGYEVWNKLFKMSVIQSNGLKFLENCHIGEDFAFNIEYAFYASSISCIENRLYNYLVRPGSAMGSSGALEKSFEESLIIAKGLKNRFESAFIGNTKEKYCQLFVKIMNHASQGYTAPETVKVAAASKDRMIYHSILKMAVDHKNDFKSFYREDLSKLYWRYCYYVLTYLEENNAGKIYFRVYNAYRRLRKRATIEEWRLI
ncbi:glycosyltransferase family 2 protein [Butyrivibrio sp. AE3006]|uniref:glycosyltransferase family 2 protein n=1 Tax=Butyrivibrio sp. AE3006 TaxID=1280673 RepID=UPI000409842E|nr:glycosyltransferase family 2 protein [Butyrivibrio sp. AE3006]